MAGLAILAMLQQGPAYSLFSLTLLTLVSRSCSSYVVRTDAGVVVMEDTAETGVSHRVKREIVNDRGVTGFNKQQKYDMLMAHNQYRSLRQGADILMMEWSSDLEETAQSYAEKCIFRHSPDRQNRAGFQTIGENLYAGTADFEPTDVVKAWYDEVQFYNYNTMGCTAGQMCGHYTQVVWASSWALGCGVKYCPTLESVSFGKGYNVVCHYGPAGNWVGNRPYQVGAVCSKCPKERKFCVRNLCALRPQIGSGARRLDGARSHDMFLLLVLIALYHTAASSLLRH